METTLFNNASTMGDIHTQRTSTTTEVETNTSVELLSFQNTDGSTAAAPRGWQIVVDMDILLYSAVAVGVFIIIIVIIIVICIKKRHLRDRNKPPSQRHHKRLCAQDSGTVSINVQRVSPGPPGSRAASLMRDASLRETYGGAYSPGHSRRSGYSPSQQRQSGYSSTSQARQSGYSPSTQDRWSPGGTRRSRYSPNQLRRPTITGQDGFDLSTSFEGGLDFVQGSAYDNHVEPVHLDRKGSTYDNVEDDGSNPLIDSVQLQHTKDSKEKRGSRTSATYQKRKNSKTMPLHFTMFDGTQYSRHQDPDEDPDYANVPAKSQRLPTQHISSYNRPKSGAQPSKSTSKAVGRSKSTHEPKPKKYKARRGSKTLSLFMNRKVPPVISKIERQVLEAVPIYGEPTPGTTPKTTPGFDGMEFPPPPTESPPPQGSEVRSHVNAMYCPFSATPGDHTGESYFSA